jgi:lipocalin-like protein
MYRVGSVITGTAAALLIGTEFFPFDAIAQGKPLREQLVGTWQYVAVDVVGPDGSRTPLYGPNPRGAASFDSKGHYILLTARASLPKFKSNDRTKATPAEDKSVVDGSIAHFGTYTVNETEKTITFHIATSTFPNWDGTEQKRPFTIIGNELKWRTPASSGGGIAEVVLKRAE